MLYGYARVSTATQGRDGNSLEDQVAALENGCNRKTMVLTCVSHVAGRNRIGNVEIPCGLLYSFVNRNAVCLHGKGSGGYRFFGEEILPLTFRQIDRSAGFSYGYGGDDQTVAE